MKPRPARVAQFAAERGFGGGPDEASPYLYSEPSSRSTPR